MNRMNIGLIAAMAVGVLHPGPQESRGATLYWDGGAADLLTDGNGASEGGAGTWDATLLNWDPGASLPHINWTNANNDIAVFGGTAGAVSLATNITVGGLQFDTAGYTIRSNTLAFGADGTIAANADATVSSALGGSAAIVKTGAGALTLSANSSYTGPLTLSNGTLKANGSTNALGTGAATLTLSGGTLDFNHSTALNFNRAVTVNGDVTIVAEKNAAGAGVTYTLAGLVIGSNTVTVSGGNVNSGTAGLTFAGPVALTGPANLSVSNPPAGGSTTLSLSNTVDNGGNLLTVGGNGTVNLGTAPISGGGGLTKHGPGVLVLGGAGTPPAHAYTGTTTIAGGVVRFQNASNSGFGPGNVTINGGVIEGYYGNSFTNTLGSDTGQVQVTGGVSGFGGQGSVATTFTLNRTAGFEVVWGSAFFNPATLVLQGPTANADGKMTLANKLDLNGTTRTIAVNGANTVGNNGATISGAIRDSTGGATVGLIKNGVGQLLLTGTNIAYSGDTTINGGRLTVGYNSATVWNGSNYAGNVFVASGAVFAVAGTTTQTVSGVISGEGGVVRGGYNGALILAGSNTYSGKTTITPTTTAGGTLVVSSFNSVNGGTPLLAASSLGCPTSVANGTIDLGSGSAQAYATLIYTNGPGETTDRVINFVFNGNGATKTLNASGAGLLKFTSTFTRAGGSGTNNDITLTGVGLGEAVGGLPFSFRNFSKSGSGIWTLGGPVSNFGTCGIGGGVLILDGSGQFADGNLALSGGGVLGLGVGDLTNRTIGTATGQVQWTGSGGFAAFGTNRAVHFGSASINWSAAGFIGGNTLILGAASADATLLWQQGISMAGGARTVQVNDGSAAVDAIMSGTIAGGTSGTANGFNKSGAGALAFTAANTYWGPTTVAAGTLQVGTGGTNGTLSANSASTVVSAGATLAVNRSDDVSQAAGGGLGDGTAVISGAGGFVQAGSGTTTLELANTYTGATVVLNGALVVNGSLAAGSAVAVVGGTLGGVGVIGGTVTNGGVVAPGASTGTLNVIGGYEQTATGSLHIEIGGTTPGVQHDQLAVVNAAILAGALTVTFTNGYAGVTNDSFTILTASAISGTFATTNLPSLGVGSAWNVEYQSGAVVLSITNAGGPPPATGYDLFALQITNGLTGYQQDADGDGYANLLEYATGGNPTNADTVAQMNGSRTNGVLALHFRRSITATDATFHVEASYTATNGAPWTGIATNVAGSWGVAPNVSEAGGPNPLEVTVQDTDPAATNRFLRLRITRP